MFKIRDSDTFEKDLIKYVAGSESSYKITHVNSISKLRAANIQIYFVRLQNFLLGLQI